MSSKLVGASFKALGGHQNPTFRTTDEVFRVLKKVKMGTLRNGAPYFSHLQEAYETGEESHGHDEG